MEKAIKKVVKEAYKGNLSPLSFLCSLKIKLCFLLEENPHLGQKALEILDYAWFKFWLDPLWPYYIHNSDKSPTRKQQ